MKEEEGEAVWFAGALMVLKAAGDQTDGRMAAMDQKVPPHYTAPLHSHHNEDEAWFILEGGATFYCGDDRFEVGTGGWIYLPKLVPHAFRVGDSGARLLTLTAPAGFADFVREAGEPARVRDVQPAEPPDMEHLAEVAKKYGVELLGPAPV